MPRRLAPLAALALALAAALWFRASADQTITIPGQTVTIAPQTFTVRTPGLNVKDFGAVPNDGLPDTVAFEAAIAATQTIDDSWNLDNRPQGGDLIFVPPGVYEFDRSVVWPDLKSAHFVSSDHGARFTMPAGGAWTTIPATNRNRSAVFDGIIFHRCFVPLAPGARISFRFEHCLFESAPDYAIKALGDSVHNVSIIDCMFSRCDGGAIFQARNCEAWHIERCYIWRCGGAFSPVCLQSTWTTLRNTDFETVPNGYTLPYITLLNGFTTLDQCRFGGESTTGYRPPAYCVGFGLPAGIMGAPANPSYIQGVRVVNCQAQGSVGMGLPSAQSGNGFCQFHVPVCDTVFANNTFLAHAGALVDESPLTAPTFSFGNVWRDNAVSVTHAGAVFSADGMGFGIAPQGGVYDTTLNLSLPTFGKTAGVLVEQNGGTQWYKVTIDSQGDFLRYMHTAGLSTNMVVAEIDGVAGTLDKLRVDLFDDTAGKAVTSANDTRRLSKTRERLVVVGKWVPGNKLSLFVRPGDANAAAGTVFIARPSLRFSNVVQ